MLFIFRGQRHDLLRKRFPILLTVLLLSLQVLMVDIRGSNIEKENISIGELSTGASIVINEVYPDPGTDVNGDGDIDQMDEFIELFNSGPFAVDISGWSLNDNYGSFTLDSIVIGTGSHTLIPRSMTGLKLGRTDMVILSDINGTEMDRHEYDGIGKGDSIQRIPDGTERWSVLEGPTPGTENPPPPEFLINEVMVDPDGANTGSQWVEIINTGPKWNIDGFRITDHDSFDITLPDLSAGSGRRIVVHSGTASDLPPMPDGTLSVTCNIDDTLYVSGDDIELLDMDGYTLDYLAWGSSSHVDRPTGIGESGRWEGKYYDESNGTMSREGEENPRAPSGRSLSRFPDMKDTDSPDDLSAGPVSTGGTPGWNNSMDPGIEITTEIQEIMLDEGESTEMELTINSTGGMVGQMDLKTTADDKNWTVSLKASGDNITMVNGGSVKRDLIIQAPDRMDVSTGSRIMMICVWDDLPFIEFSTCIRAVIPYFDCALDEMEAGLEVSPLYEFPEGSIIGITGKVRCEGMLDGGDINCTAQLIDPDNGILVSSTTLFRNLRSTSARSVEFHLDTLGIEGNLTLTVLLDPEDRVREPDERNNAWEVPIRILPTTLGEDERSLVISKALWNTTPDRGGVEILNTGETSVDISGMRVTDGIGWYFFPEGSVIRGEERILVAFGDSWSERFPEHEIVFRCDGEGPGERRMLVGEGFDLPLDQGRIQLTTGYRDVIDEVIVKRECLPGGTSAGSLSSFAETTWDTMFFRRSDSIGDPVDTDSPMDWTVSPVSGRIDSLLIDPGPEGPGEFLSVSGDIPGTDLSGMAIVRGTKIAVIPNGTCFWNSSIVLAGDPSSFRNVQMEEPDLCLDWSDRSDLPDCRVAGWGFLNLPNNGGELELVDNGNRHMMNVSWGPGTEMEDIQSGGIITLPFSCREGSMWRLSGCGNLPFFSEVEKNSDLRFAQGEKEMYDSFAGRGACRMTAIISDLKDPWLASILAGIRESGTYMDIYMTSGLATGNDPGAVDQGPGHIGFLSDLGARIFVLEDPLDELFPPVFFSSSSLWTMDAGPDNRESDETAGRNCMGLVTKNETSQKWFNSIKSMIDGHEWYDPGVLLSETESEKPAIRISYEDGNLSENSQPGAEISLNWCIDPSNSVKQSEHLRMVHSGGPIDVVTIMELADRVSSISLAVSPGILCVEGADSPYLMDEFRDRLKDRCHGPGWNDLSDDVMIRLRSISDLCESEGIELNITLIEEDLNGGTFNRWYWQGGMAFQIARDLSTGIGCWVIRTWTEYESNPNDQQGIGSRMFPEYLVPGREDGVEPLPEGEELMIDRIYYDTYLKEDPDEAVRISNKGNTIVDLSGFMITDDEGHHRRSDGILTFPDGVLIHPGEHLWIARDGGLFEFQFGESADLCMFNSTGCPFIGANSGDMRLANTNDTVSLRDPEGRLLDVVPYGGSEWNNVWEHFQEGRWEGEPAPGSGWGSILFRWKEWDHEFPEDTNSANDWISPRRLYPGQSFLPVSEEMNIDSMECGINPDSGTDILQDAISMARDSIILNVYEITSGWIVSSLIGASERGIDVKVILEGGPVGGTSYTEEVLADRMTSCGIEVRWMMNVIDQDIRDRYRYDHAKYLVVDGRICVISTDNLKDSSFPGTLTGGGGTRGWIVSMVSEELSDKLEELFFLDWNGSDMIDNTIDHETGDLSFAAGSHEFDPASDSGFHRSGTIRGAGARIMICPDHISVPDNPLFKCLRNAERTIDLELMDITTHFTDDREQPPGRFMERWDIPHDSRPFQNPYLNILFSRAKDGVKVRLLVDGSDFDGDSIPDNQRTVSEIREAVERYGIGDLFEVRLHPEVARDQRGEISLIHTKGAIIDGKSVWLSSFNWGPTSAYENREVGVLISSREAGQYYSGCFENDWGNTLQSDMKIQIRYALFDKRDDGSTGCRLSFTASSDMGGEFNLSLVSEHEGNDLCGSVELAGPLDGTYIEELEVCNCSEGDPIVLIASLENRSTRICEFTVEFVNDEGDLGGEITGTDIRYLPVLIIIMAVVAISSVRSVFVRIRDGTRIEDFRLSEE